jgi:hypothetical protein
MIHKTIAPHEELSACNLPSTSPETLAFDTG